MHRATRLVDHLKAHLVVVRVRDIGTLITRGAVTVGGRVGRIDTIVNPDDDVVAIVGGMAALGDALVPASLALVIAHEDDDVLVVDKPAGMHVHPLGAFRDGTLLNGLLWHAGARADHPWGAWRPSPAHRLDRAASGLIAIAKRAAVHDALRAPGALVRRYRATVVGELRGDAGTIDAPLGRDPTLDYRRAVVADGQRAVTHWRVVARGEDTTTIELDLETGRTHQIRAHLASLGHPIVGDTLYATRAESADSAAAIALRAIELRYRQPTSGATITCTL